MTWCLYEEKSFVLFVLIVFVLHNLLERYETIKDGKLFAHKRVVWRIESEIAECSRKIREIKLHYDHWRETMRKTLAELSNLHKVR